MAETCDISFNVDLVSKFSPPLPKRLLFQWDPGSFVSRVFESKTGYRNIFVLPLCTFQHIIQFCFCPTWTELYCFRVPWGLCEKLM